MYSPNRYHFPRNPFCVHRTDTDFREELFLADKQMPIFTALENRPQLPLFPFSNRFRRFVGRELKKIKEVTERGNISVTSERSIEVETTFIKRHFVSTGMKYVYWDVVVDVYIRYAF